MRVMYERVRYHGHRKPSDNTVCRIPYDNKPSTLQDLEAGHKTEIDMFAGGMVRMGKELGIETPICWMLLQGIKALEEKN